MESLNETPFKISSAKDLLGFSEFTKKTLEEISELKEPPKRFNSKYSYILSNKYFVLLIENKILAWVLYKRKNDIFLVQNIDNPGKIPGASLLIFEFLLDKNLFSEIHTGKALTPENIKAHKNFFKSSFVFQLLIKDKSEVYRNIEQEDIEPEMKKFSTESFVLRKGSLREATEMYSFEATREQIENSKESQLNTEILRDSLYTELSNFIKAL